jgi:ubiquinone/menaquinone biosynthesis C-methylase UbiE
MTGIKLRSNLAETYEEYYEDGESEWRRLCAVQKADSIVSLCRNLPHASILEIGAGEGAILSRLSELGFGERMHALEISPSGAAAIRSREIPNVVACDLYDGTTVPYGEGTFDLAILSHVIEHVEHPRQLLYEASRVARYVFVEVPLEDTLRLPRDFVLSSVGHINFYSRKGIRRLLQSCNLRVLGEKVQTPAKEAYVYRSGRKGLIQYYVKEAMLRASVRFATMLSTYHGALVCEKSQPVPMSRGAIAHEFQNR